MKKFLLSFFSIIILILGSRAQPVINSADVLPTQGEKFDLRSFDPASIPAGAGGMNVIWDFSFLPSGKATTTNVLDPASTANGANYPNANLCIDQDGTLLYFLGDNDEFSLYGEIIDGNDAIYTDRDEKLIFPLTFGLTSTDQFSGTAKFNIPSYGTLTSYRKGVTDIFVDGYGTLKLPGLEFDSVLRVKTVSVQEDSVKILVFDSIVDTEIVTYQWYKAGIRTPLLSMIKISTEIQPDTIYNGTYINLFVGVEEFSSNISNFNVMQTEDGSMIQVMLNSRTTENYHFYMINSLGQRVKNCDEIKVLSGTNSFNFDIANLPAGVYSIVADGDEIRAGKFIISR